MEVMHCLYPHSSPFAAPSSQPHATILSSPAEITRPSPTVNLLHCGICHSQQPTSAACTPAPSTSQTVRFLAAHPLVSWATLKCATFFALFPESSTQAYRSTPSPPFISSACTHLPALLLCAFYYESTIGMHD